MTQGAGPSRPGSGPRAHRAGAWTRGPEPSPSGRARRVRGVPAGGEIPERPNGPDCKSGGSAFGGSNPPLPTTTRRDHGRCARRSRPLRCTLIRPAHGDPTLPMADSAHGRLSTHGRPGSDLSRAAGSSVRSRPRPAGVVPRAAPAQPTGAVLAALAVQRRCRPHCGHRSPDSRAELTRTRAQLAPARGRSSMVERQPSKLHTWVRFPSPAPPHARARRSRSASFHLGTLRSGTFRSASFADTRSQTPVRRRHTAGDTPQRDGPSRIRHDQARSPGPCCCSSVVEHFLGKEEVMGSSPISSSITVARDILRIPSTLPRASPSSHFLITTQS